MSKVLAGIKADGTEMIRNQKNKKNPEENGIKTKYNWEIIFTILCFIFLILGLILERTTENNTVHHIAYYIAYFFGGYFAMKEALADIVKGKFEIDFLMIFAAVGAAILGKHSEGTLLLFLFSLGNSLENYALERAKKQIKALNDLTSSTASVKRDGEIVSLPIEEVKLGDIVIVRAGSKVPVDGVIILGESSVNQAPITGESNPVEKMALEKDEIRFGKDFSRLEEKNKVFAGTINGEGVLEVEVLKISADSTLSRLIKMVNEAESKQSPTQQFTKNIEKYYVPFILLFVIILCFAFLVLSETPAESFYRAMRVLVGGSPCALAISTPSAVLSGIARAAKERVLIKGGKALEVLGGLHTIAFDKTGTLTEGIPIVKNIEVYNMTENELVNILFAVESLSTHPIAKSIVKKCNEILKGNRNDIKVSDIKNIAGKGIVSVINNEKVYIGSRNLMIESGFTLTQETEDKIDEFAEKGYTTMIVGLENKGISGIVSLIDEPREGVKEVVRTLKEIGVADIMMLSGDNPKVAQTIGSELGITTVKGGLLPEDKLKEIEKVKNSGLTIAMVGDGVNDAPAMAVSNVGIAMGAAGSDVALETADVALLADKLENLPFVIGLSKEAKKIIRQNLIISLGMIVFLIPASLFGLTEMGPTVIFHEGTTVAVVFNALRLLTYKNKLKK